MLSSALWEMLKGLDNVGGGQPGEEICPAAAVVTTILSQLAFHTALLTTYKHVGNLFRLYIAAGACEKEGLGVTMLLLHFLPYSPGSMGSTVCTQWLFPLSPTYMSQFLVCQ